MRHQIGKLFVWASMLVGVATLTAYPSYAADQESALVKKDAVISEEIKPEAIFFNMDFSKARISIQDWTEIPIPKEATLDVKDGKVVVRVKALPALTADASTSVNFDMIPKLPLDKSAKVEWGFRYKGAGLKAATMCVKSSYNQEKKRIVASKSIQIVPVAGNGFSDWQRDSVKAVEKTDKLGDISYWDLSLKFAPGADFTIEIDYIKVLPDGQP